jgi:hypothetical protein
MTVDRVAGIHYIDRTERCWGIKENACFVTTEHTSKKPGGRHLLFCKDIFLDY